jgi:ribosomal protein S6--L-glutamate ligase
MIISTRKELLRHYHELRAGDVYRGSLSGGHLGLPLSLDLMRRGVHCFPSALSQCLSRSKTMQAVILSPFMMPLTRPVMRRADLMRAIGIYRREGIGAVVTKQEGIHCGHGIRRWPDVEAAYNHFAFNTGEYPFVLQPFAANIADVRVVVVDDYAEAYRRVNPHNFRSNLSSGGCGAVHDLSRDDLQFCRRVMERGGFPYAHLDLQMTPDGRRFLAEISLNGGLRGAAVGRRELERMKNAKLQALVDAV